MTRSWDGMGIFRFDSKKEQKNARYKPTTIGVIFVLLDDLGNNFILALSIHQTLQ